MPHRLNAFMRKNRRNLLALSAIIFAAAALYLPFIGNELIFDDTTFFYRGNVLSYYATRPLDLAPRTFPYFTFAFIHTVTQSFEAQRVFNLAVHVCNAWLLFRISEHLLRATSPNPGVTKNADVPPLRKREFFLCCLFALAFALHPVAVYGTAYLVQRTILFATLFSLLSLLSFCRALGTNTWKQLILASVFSSCAILSKQHAVTLPFAVSTLIAVFFWDSGNLKALGIKTASYVLLCTPAMLLATYASKSSIARAYEPHISQYLAIAVPEQTLWFTSVLVECSLFFQYFRLWLLPDVSRMSIDLRYAFPETWFDTQSLIGGFCFAGACLLSAGLLIRSKHFKLAGFGLAYALVLFSVELTTVRIQEPFVLYRSYLWAPGFLFFAISLLRKVPFRVLAPISLVALPALAFQAENRLDSLSNARKVWEDAALKLSSENLSGAFRIYHNRGISYINAKNYDLALGDMELCQRLNTAFPGCFVGEAIVLERRHDFLRALDATEKALALNAKDPASWERKGRLLQALRREQEAASAYAKAEQLGGSMATLIRRGSASSHREH